MKVWRGANKSKKVCNTLSKKNLMTFGYRFKIGNLWKFHHYCQFFKSMYSSLLLTEHREELRREALFSGFFFMGLTGDL